jgi:O-antigen/teichoic acid export membrane protein
MTLARKVAVTTASLVAGRVVAVLAGVATVGLASRYLGLDGFGTLTLAMSIVAFVALLTDIGLSTMAAREIAREPEREREILGNVLTLGLALAVGGVAGLALIAEVGYGGDEQMREALLILGAQVVAAPFVGVARAHFQGVQRGQLIAVGDIALAVGMLAASAACVAADLGFAALAAATATGYVAQAIVMTVMLPGGVRLAWSGSRATWRHLLLISLPFGATVVVNYLYFRLDVLLLSFLRDTEEVAVYGLAYRVLEGLIVLPAYFMFALFPEIARLTSDRARVDGIVVAALEAMQVLAIPLVGLGIVFADDIVAVIGGAEFEDSDWVLRILMLALGISYLSGVFGNALVAIGRQNALFKWSLVVLGANLVANLALIPPYGAIGASIAVVASEALAFFVVRALYGAGGLTPRVVPDPRILLAGAAMVAVVALKFLLPDGALGALPTVLLGGALGLVVYGVAMAVLGAVPEAIAAQLPRRLSSLGRSS